jgi:hypothetical protein
MRNYTLVALLSLFVVNTFAQQPLTQRESLVNEFAQTVKGEKDAASRVAAFSYFINAGSGQNRGTDAMAQRLIGYLEQKYTGGVITAVDSNTWIYSVNRGSTVVGNEVYDQRRRWILSAGTMEPDYRYIRTWNVAGQNGEFLQEDWSGNAFVNEYRTQYNYDAAGNRTHRTLQMWTGSAWKYVNRSIFTFVGSKPVIETQSNWQDSVWVPTFQYSYSYDANGYLAEELYQQYSADSLYNMFHFIYSNDAVGNRLQELERHWVVNAWQNFSRKANTYSQGKLANYVLERWITNAWFNEAKLEYTYTPAGLVLTELTYQGNGAGWDTTHQKHFVYNGTQLILDSTLVLSLNTWRKDSRNIYTYDANGNADVVTVYDGVSNNWVNKTRIDYNFNTGYNNLDSALTERWLGGNWQTDYKRYYYYEEYNAPSAVTTLQQVRLAMSVYPNPAVTTLNVDFASAETGEGCLRVYTVNGQQVQLHQVILNIGDNYLPLDVSNLSSGLYIVELQTSTGIVRSKFYKQ